MVNVITYLIYLAISLTATWQLGRRLNQSGLVFLTHQLNGEQSLARAINNLLLIGFYLINVGYILLVINLNGFGLVRSEVAIDLSNEIYFLTRNIGLVVLMLGGMHMMLLYVLAHWHPTVARSESASITTTSQS